nr:MAG TPA: hypothetical protein [Bacteriophage sp.]DAM81461.1 MAG TPA: hypothetical protein [Caudoviricetes sp.]
MTEDKTRKALPIHHGRVTPKTNLNLNKKNNKLKS